MRPIFTACKSGAGPLPCVFVISLNKLLRICADKPPLCENRKTRLSLTKFPLPLAPSRRNKSYYFQKDTRIARLSSPSSYVQAKPSGDRILATRGNSGAPNFTAIDPAKLLTRQSCIFSVLPTAQLVHAPTTPNWVRPVAGPLYGVSKYFFTSRNPHGTSIQKTTPPRSTAPTPPPAVATFIPALLRDKGYACLYLKAADRMKCTMELSPHVAFREVEECFPRPGGSGAPYKPPQKKTLRQKCLPDVQQHVYSCIR